MARSLRKPAGWREILETPEHLKAEVVAGELWTSPRPHPAHGRCQAVLSSELSGPFDLGKGGPGGWWILIEPDVQLSPQDIVSPDVVGWRRETLPEFPSERPVATVPDWVCEVLSPSSAGRDRTLKADLYLQAGVRHLLLVDPEQRTLEAFEGKNARWLRLGAWSDGDRVGVPPFAEREMEVAALFPPAGG